nr:hypothetical protein [Methanobacterium formicicum]
MGIISVYPSHYTLSVNRHTTESSLKGTEWFINNKNTNLSYSTWYFAPDRYAGRLGIEKLRADVTKYNSVPFPAHFGYNVNSTLGESYTKDTYLLIPDFLKVVYVYTFPERANEMLTTSDFNRLNEDNSLDKLYSDGGFDLWYIHSK